MGTFVKYNGGGTRNSKICYLHLRTIKMTMPSTKYFIIYRIFTNMGTFIKYSEGGGGGGGGGLETQKYAIYTLEWD